jgi:hypothetical protein
MVLYDYDSNAILSKPVKTRQASELTQAWTALHSRLQFNGYAPDLHILDNECSDELKKAFKKTRRRLPTRSPPCSPSKLCRARNPNLEESFLRWACNM